MKTTVSVLLAVIIVAVFALYFLRFETPRRPDPAGQEARTPRQTAPGPGKQRGESAQATADTAEISPPNEEPTDAGSSAEAAQDINLSGTVIVLDEAGAEHTEEDGTFYLTSWQADSGNGTEVTVEKGRWKADVPDGERFEVEKLRVGGRWAYTDTKRLPIPEDRLIEIRAVWFKPATLRVIGEDTRADLSGVEVVLASEEMDEDLQHPGNFPEEAVVAKDERSPFQLAGKTNSLPSSQETFWVRAPEYAWTRIQVDLRTGGERQVILKRAAELEVTLVNYRPESKAVVRVRKSGPKHEPEPANHKSKTESPEATVSEILDSLRRSVLITEVAPDANSPTLITGLAPGSYAISAEVGLWYKEPTTLASAAVKLQAGTRTQITLTLEDVAPEQEPVPLEGTLFLPPAWEDVDINITFEPLDSPSSKDKDSTSIELSAMTPVTNRPGLYRWSAGNVLPGRYTAEIDAWEYQQVIQVGPGGNKNARIEIAAPAEAIVRTVDADTGAVADLDELNWHCRWPEEVSGGGLHTARRRPASDDFVIKAPAGPIVIVSDSDNYSYLEDSDGVLHLHPGRNEVKLRLQRSCGIRIALKDADANVPWDWSANPAHVDEVGGAGTQQGWSSDGAAGRLRVTHPGLYELTFDPIDGFEPVPPRQVLVKRGEFTDVTVELVKLK